MQLVNIFITESWQFSIEFIEKINVEKAAVLNIIWEEIFKEENSQLKMAESSAYEKLPNVDDGDQEAPRNAENEEGFSQPRRSEGNELVIFSMMAYFSQEVLIPK